MNILTKRIPAAVACLWAALMLMMPPALTAPPAPNTAQVTLSRSDSRTTLRVFYASPLRLQISSPFDLTGVTELRAEIHAQRQTDGLQPLASSTVANPTGYSAAIDFTWQQMRLPLKGQRSVSFYLLLRATLPDGGRDVYELGTMDVAAAPVTDLAPPDPAAQLYATTDAVAASVSGLSTAAMLEQTSRLKEIVSSGGYELTSITRDADDVIVSATVRWPDGRPGVFTTLTKNTAFSAIDSFSITYVPATGTTKTISQPAVTRNGNGAVTVKPALTES